MNLLSVKGKVFDQMTDEEFFRFCAENKKLRIERSEDGEIFIDMPKYSKTGEKNAEIIYQLTHWNKQKKLGKTFDSSAGFRLQKKEMRSPDAAWISHQKWDALKEDEQDKFALVCPDFVIELKSETDVLEVLQIKMTDVWLKNGCLLGWLINPETETVYIYQANASMEIIQGFDKKLSGEDILPDFELDLKELR